MNKHVIATIALFLVVVSLLSDASAMKEGARKRSVALVYDDSGSMRNGTDRWQYASYALQSFAGLLDTDDSFSYIPMSRPSEEVVVDLQNRQQEMDAIREWKESDNTPFQSVETAIAALKRQVSASVEGEYWFIVLTDGAFNELESPGSASYEANKTNITNILQDFASWMKDQNASFHSVLITMESDLNDAEEAQMNVFKDIWRETLNGIILAADGEDGVVDSVNEAAALIANRDPFSNVEDFVSVQSNEDTLVVSTPFPIRRFTIVQQGRGAAELNQEDLAKNGFQLEGPFQVTAPEQPNLTGVISHIKKQDDTVLPSGKYEIQFSPPVPSSEQIKVLAEPALDYTVRLYQKQGSKMKEVENAVYIGSTIVVEAKPSDVPVDVSYFTALIDMEGKQLPMTWNEERAAFQYETTAHANVRGMIQMGIKGFYRQSKEFRIDAIAKPELSLRLVTTDWREKVTELQDSPPFVMQPLLDGEPMTEEEVHSLIETASVTFNKSVYYELRQNGNELHLYARPFLSDTFNFTGTGTIEAAITLRDPVFEEVTETLVFTIENVSFFERYDAIFQVVIPGAILIFVAAVLVIGWIVRPRFYGKAMIYYKLDQSISDDWIHEPEPELLRHKWWKHYLGIPYRAERRTVQSITFIAKKGTKAILVAKDSQIEGMVIDGTFLSKEEAGREHKTLYRNETVTIDRGYGKEVYRYECE